MKENLKEGVYDEASGKYFTNDFRIGYFDNKILCIEEYVDYYGGGLYVNQWYNYTIISLETGKKLNNDFFKDLVDYNEEFNKFLKKEFIKYHEISEDDFDDYYLPELAFVDDYYYPTIFIFNNDGTIDISNRSLPYVSRVFEVKKNREVKKIEMKKLKPYLKKDSFYKYLFD